MMHGMMGDGTAGAMMWGMGLFGVLAAIALAKYIFSGR